MERKGLNMKKRIELKERISIIISNPTWWWDSIIYYGGRTNGIYYMMFLLFIEMIES